MRLLQATVPNDCDIVLHGDNHEGALASHTKAVDNLIEWIMAEPNRYYIHMGDEIEPIGVEDGRHSDFGKDFLEQLFYRLVSSQAGAYKAGLGAVRPFEEFLRLFWIKDLFDDLKGIGAKLDVWVGAK